MKKTKHPVFYALDTLVGEGERLELQDFIYLVEQVREDSDWWDQLFNRNPEYTEGLPKQLDKALLWSV